MTMIGYARVSTDDQSLEVQEEQLRAAGCEKIFSEKRSGADAERPRLKDCMDFVREGDVLVVCRLDRLARSVWDLIGLIDRLEAKKVGFRCIHQPVETVSSTGRLMITMLAAFAEFELDIRKERQAEGIKRAQARGVYKRQSKTTADRIMALRAQGMGASAIAKELGVDRTTVYRTCPASWGPNPIPLLLQ